MEMEGKRFLRRCSFLLAILTMLKLNGVEASVYTVGDEEGWSSQTDFDLWANRYVLIVGDVLAFKYVKGEHNVYEVTEDTFRTCDASRGVLAKYESGDDEVNLSEAKRYWFICNIAGHCLGGMRFGIDVKQSNIAALTPQVQPPPPPPSHISCANIYATQTWRVISYLVPFELLLFKLYSLL